MSVPAIKVAPKGSPVEKRWKAAELRSKLHELRMLMRAGKSDLEACEEMGLDIQAYNALKKELYTQEKMDLHGKSVEDVFIDYKFAQAGCLADLDEMITNFKSTKQYNAMVGAIRAKSDIIDKVIARGQEFGLIEKVPEKKMVIGGVMVAGLNMDELRGFLAKQLTGLDALTKRYGATDILGNPLPAGGAPPALPAPGPARTATVAAAASSAAPAAPAFSGKGKPHFASGGLTKAAGGKAKAAAAREGA